MKPVNVKIDAKQMQALGIQVSVLQRQTDAVLASFPAQVMAPPNSEQIISSPVAGLVLQVLVQPNQAVRRGAPLLRLAGPDWGALQLQLLQTATRATLARLAAQREQSLFDEGIIPQRRAQEAQAAMQESTAALNQARAALRFSGMPEAAIKRVETSGKLEDSLVLHATQAGVVTSIAVKPGQRVEAASALLHVAQTAQLWLEIQVPAAEAANWQPGTKFKLQGRDITARIVSLSPSVSAGSQTLALRAVIESGAHGLRPGEIVAVELPAAGSAGGWSVPLAAVAHDGKQAYVFIRSADGFEARPVSVLASAGQRVRVQGALKDGEQIAISSIVALKGAWLAEKEKGGG
ncbi:MAG: efflux RND transporter periplasmic adaptor subunit [Hydrogenophilales bacterium]|nr:efflux RND transporter periplasmic adaptor subunit [Hydrogenophilales bacterium]